MYRWKAYNQQDIVDELKRRGHIVDEIRGEMATFDEDAGFSERFEIKLDSEIYDMVMTVNYFPLISESCQARNILYVSWCCDCPLGTMYNSTVFNDVNRIFTFDMINHLTFKDMNAPVYYLPLCGAPERVDALLESVPNDDKYSCDISFIGSMYNKNSYDEIYEHLPDYLKGYFDATIKMQMDIYGDNMLDDMLDAKTIYEINRHFVLAKSEKSFSDLPLIFSTTVLGFKIAQMERKSILSYLDRDFCVDVYTDDENVSFVRSKNRGLADYWKEAPIIFNRSKINLNFTIKNIRSGIPLRVWDILSAGGFCITNYQKELLMYFENGKDIVFFESKEDLRKKIHYYLEHEGERRQIALNGYNKVKKLHNYKKRIDEMANVLNFDNF